MNLKSTYPKFLLLALLFAANITSANAASLSPAKGDSAQIQPNSSATTQNTDALFLLPKDTIIKVQLEEDLNSNRTNPEELIEFKTIGDLRSGTALLLPLNTIVYGKIVKLKHSNAWDFPGRIEIAFTDINAPGNTTIAVNGSLGAEGKKPNFFIRYSLLGILVKENQQ